MMRDQRPTMLIIHGERGRFAWARLRHATVDETRRGFGMERWQAEEIASLHVGFAPAEARRRYDAWRAALEAPDA